MVKRDLIRNIIFLIIALVALICLRIFVYTPYQVEAKDSNRFLAKDNLVIANKKEKIRRDDFVLYEVDGKEYLGRVIALENDKVSYMDDILYLNDKIKAEEYLTKDKEKYLSTSTSTGYFTHDFTIQTLTNSAEDKIPANKYLILNDNRRNMNDSREFGLISEDQIEGVVNFRLLPLDKFGFIKTRQSQ